MPYPCSPQQKGGMALTSSTIPHPVRGCPHPSQLARPQLCLSTALSVQSLISLAGMGWGWRAFIFKKQKLRTGSLLRLLILLVYLIFVNIRGSVREGRGGKCRYFLHSLVCSETGPHVIQAALKLGKILLLPPKAWNCNPTVLILSGRILLCNSVWP